ncbi:MAG TPA: hypothetical protein VM142_06810 [Acidimicrobiales bacterium]|nr:hypothetical protein [Acidimicrobiales bacterium]
MADLVSNMKDAGYVALGFALLGIQQAQVRRRELEKELRRLMADRCGEKR